MVLEKDQEHRGILLVDQTADSGIQGHMEEDTQGGTGWGEESWEGDEVGEGGAAGVVVGLGSLDETVGAEPVSSMQLAKVLYKVLE